MFSFSFRSKNDIIYFFFFFFRLALYLIQKFGEKDKMTHLIKVKIKI